MLNGVGVDILAEGGLDLPDAVQDQLYLVVGAAHSKLHLSLAEQTRRILNTMDHPRLDMLPQATGRLIDQGEPYDVDMATIIRRARDRGCFLELNAHPERLDLADIHCQMAGEEGGLVSIACDAHGPLDFANLVYGIGQARRGWLEMTDVRNTRQLKERPPPLRQRP